jgi:hypothetical protein
MNYLKLLEPKIEFHRDVANRYKEAAQSTENASKAEDFRQKANAHLEEKSVLDKRRANIIDYYAKISYYNGKRIENAYKRAGLDIEKAGVDFRQRFDGEKERTLVQRLKSVLEKGKTEYLSDKEVNVCVKYVKAAMKFNYNAEKNKIRTDNIEKIQDAFLFSWLKPELADKIIGIASKPVKGLAVSEQARALLKKMKKERFTDDEAQVFVRLAETLKLK